MKVRSQKPAHWNYGLELKALRKKDLLRKLTCVESSDPPYVVVDGHTYINFSSNDYLGLSVHKDIVKAASAAMKKYGFGSGASRLLSGTLPPHKELEERTAGFKKTGAALLFNSGYAANTGIIPALVGKGCVIFSDELNHASIIDGARLSGADVKIYRHRDADHLGSLLKKCSGTASVKRRLVITDTVFSMDGDIAPLKDIAMLSDKFGVMLMVDDAHATGVLGKTGRGALEHFSIRPDSIIQMGTFSKALGCFGAFAAGEKGLIGLLINRARSFMYSTALPPAVAAAAAEAIDIVEHRSTGTRKRLWKNRQRLSDGLKALGFDTLGSETPIVPVLVGTADAALKVSKYLRRSGIFAPAIRPPTVPEGKCRIRFSVTAAHRHEDIDLVLECMRRI
ncbi:MAG: 8-amino-7-oxononanoate synthase [Nitrospirota bacterium]|nr:8-amino-7-oxononanoate synthase [Nitrospirota bacterium]